MYTDEYKKALELVKTLAELEKDYRNQQRCAFNLRCFDRDQAWDCIQDIIKEYHAQIEYCGWRENMRLYSNVPKAQVSDTELQKQLMYFGARIPTYVLARESNKELAKKMCEWLDHHANCD